MHSKTTTKANRACMNTLTQMLPLFCSVSSITLTNTNKQCISKENGEYLLQYVCYDVFAVRVLYCTSIKSQLGRNSSFVQVGVAQGFQL